MPTRSRFALVLLAALSLFAAACGDDDSGEVNVFAAASLTDAFEQVGAVFEEANPEASVTFNFAASSELVTQINEGAPADVYASADTNNMQKLVDAGGNAAEPQVFVTNRLEIAVEPGNPLSIADLADLADPDVTVVLCAEEVPCGRFAKQILDGVGVQATPASLEENVRAVLNKVVLGEADAGIVYVTDVLAADGDVDGVEIPDDQNAVAEYPIVVTNEAPNPEAGQAFVDFVTGPDGLAILDDFGFGTT